MVNRLRELATAEALAHGYDCDSERERQRAIDLAVMFAEQRLKEFAEEAKAEINLFRDTSISDDIDATLRTFLGEDAR